MAKAKRQALKPRYITVEGLRFAESFSPEAIRSALDYQPRPNDVFVVTYPKCGTSWMMQIVLLILHQGELPENPEEYFACTPFLEMLGAEAAEKMPRPSPIRTHLPFDLVPFAPYAKYIYVARHPRECCVSFYHHTKLFPAYGFSKGSFDEFFELFVQGETDYNDYFDHLLSWYEHRNEPNVLFISYEEMKKDDEAAIFKIADFLGEEYGKLVRENDEVMDRIIEFSSFDYMRQGTEKSFKEMLKISSEVLTDPTLPPGLKSWAESAIDSQYEFPVQLSVRDLMRRSSLIEWETPLSISQEERLKERIREKTRGTDVMKLWD